MHLSCFWQQHISAHVESLDGDGDTNTATLQRFNTSGLFYSRGQVLNTATLPTIYKKLKTQHYC